MNEEQNSQEGWSLSDIGHGIFDIIGLIPVVGEPVDAANAIWYATEGKYLDAGLSLISIIPLVGDAIGKGGKVAKKLGPVGAKKLVKILDQIDIQKFLKQFRKHPKLGKHIDKISDALSKWSDDLTKKFSKGDVGKPLPCNKVAEKKVAKKMASKIPDWPSDKAKELLKQLDKAKTPAAKRKISEQLGNEGAKNYLRKKLGKNIPDGDFKVFEGRDVFNVVYKDPQTGKVYVMEAKGGKGQLGTRLDGASKSVPQDGKTYFNIITNKMATSKYKGKKAKDMIAERARRQEVGKMIKDAKKQKKVEYIGVRADYDKLTPSKNSMEPKEIFRINFGGEK